MLRCHLPHHVMVAKSGPDKAAAALSAAWILLQKVGLAATDKCLCEKINNVSHLLLQQQQQLATDQAGWL